jgi:hypothetical protein
MATIGTAGTLQDMAKRLDANGKVDNIVEMLTQTNEILEDMLWLEGNLPTGHKTTIRAGLPTVAWRLLNYGVPNSKSQTTQVTDTCGMLEAYAEVDKVLADLNGNTAEFRLSEDRAFLESMNQAQAQSLIYGDTSVNPERFVGLAPRYSSLSAANGGNIISAGGSTNLTSIWLVCWSDLTAHGIFPKGSKAGFQHNDLSPGPEGVTLFDANNNKYQGYRTHYKWDCGFTLRDWRYVVRIANIDTAALTKNAASGSDLIDLMTQAIELLPNQKIGRPVFYCNQKIRSYLRRQITNKVASSTLTMETVAGKKVIGFDDIPVRRVDQILNTETQVS